MRRAWENLNQCDENSENWGFQISVGIFSNIFIKLEHFGMQVAKNLRKFRGFGVEIQEIETSGPPLLFVIISNRNSALEEWCRLLLTFWSFLNWQTTSSKLLEFIGFVLLFFFWIKVSQPSHKDYFEKGISLLLFASQFMNPLPCSLANSVIFVSRWIIVLPLSKLPYFHPGASHKLLPDSFLSSPFSPNVSSSLLPLHFITPSLAFSLSTYVQFARCLQIL